MNSVDKPQSSLETVLSQYTELFSEGLGKLRGREVKLRLRLGAVPKFYKPRPVPFALREVVNKELDRLEALGFIRPAASSEWAAPIVPEVKRDKSIR